MNYCGIDLASKTSAVCIDDEAGRVVTECEVATDEDGLRTRLAHVSPLRCVLEASPLAEWAAQLLEELGHEVVVIDPRRAKAVICTKRKTDQIDARNLAKMARTGWYTAVHRKSASARRMRTLLKARAGLLGAARSQQSRILGLLRAHGVKVPGARGEQFEPRVRETVRQRAPELEEVGALGPRLLHTPATVGAELDALFGESDLPRGRTGICVRYEHRQIRVR